MITIAEYSKSNLPDQYWGNPLIECLPSIKTVQEVAEALLRKPDVKLASSRMQSPHIRLHDVAMINQLFIPRSEWFTFESELGILLRQGLKTRNPFSSETQKYLHDIKKNIASGIKEQARYANPFAGAIFVPALSGSGKTRGIIENLSMYPQTVEHTSYQGKPFVQRQVVWLSVEAPINGSIKGFLHRLFVELDEALGNEGNAMYAHMYRSASISWDRQIINFSQAAASHFLGVLHIDDLQRLLEANQEQRNRIFGFIVQLANVAKIPLVLSGTHKMSKLLARSFEGTRRATSSGFINLPHARTENDEFFKNLVTALFRYQWLDIPLALDSKIFESLHKWTMGLPFLVVGIFQYGQKIALRSGSKEFRLDHLQQAYDGPYKLLHPALNALRKGDVGSLQRFEDLLPTEEQMEQVLLEYERKLNDEMKERLIQAMIAKEI